MRLGWRAGIVATVLAGYAFINLSAADPGSRSSAWAGAWQRPGSFWSRWRADLPNRQQHRLHRSGDVRRLWLGLTYTGHDDVFLASPDRGPFDGRTSVPYCRSFPFPSLTADLEAVSEHQATLLDTRLPEERQQDRARGRRYAFNRWLDDDRRFDPGGVRSAATAASSSRTSTARTSWSSIVRDIWCSGFRCRKNSWIRYRIRPVTLTRRELARAYPDSIVRTSGESWHGRPCDHAGRPDAGRLMQNALIQDHGVNPATVGRVGLNDRSSHRPATGKPANTSTSWTPLIRGAA